jgi:hypothetical protein
MSSSDKDSVSNLVSVFSALNKIKDEPKGISPRSSVVKDENERVNPNLESTEIERLKKIATIFGQTLQIGLFAPKPEAQKLQDLTPDKQKSLGISAIGDKIKPIKQEGGGLMSLLTGLLGLLGFGNIKSIMKKTLGWIGGKLSGILKWVGGKLWSGIKWLTGKLLSSVKWIGGKMWQGLKGLGTKVSSIIGGLVSRIKNSKAYKGLMGIVNSAASGIKNLWNNALKGISGFVDNLVAGITKLKDGALNLVKKIPGYDLVKKGFEKTVQAGKAAVNVAVKSGKAVGGVVKEVAEDTLEGAKKIGQGQLSKIAGRFLGKGARVVGGFLKRIPLIGPLITALFTAGEIRDLEKQYTEGKITLDDLQYKIGKAVLSSVTGLGGAAIGATLGSLLGPVGTIIGGIGGDFLGKWVGDLLVEKLMSPDMVKKIGSYFQKDRGTPTTDKDNKEFSALLNQDEMQDFLVRNGQVYKFNTRDEVLGMKTGGAIDNLLKSQTDSAMVDSIVSHNKFNKTALIEQIKRQDTMIELLMQLVRKPSGGSVINHSSSNNVSSSNFRDAYSSQTLVTN